MAKKLTNSKLAEKVATQLQLLVRLKASDKDGNCTCVSCGVVGHWSSMQGGHYVGRGRNATKLLEENIHPQCRRCNLRATESHVGYSLFVIETYGIEKIAEFKELMNKPHKWIRKDLEAQLELVNKQIEDEKAKLGL